MIKKKAMKLVKALRSGQYSQGTRLLVDANDNFCCLGVACNISNLPLEWEKLENTYRWQMQGKMTILPEDIQKEYGFYSDIGFRRDNKAIKIGGKAYSSLADANDLGCTFEEIADYIEEHWEHF